MRWPVAWGSRKPMALRWGIIGAGRIARKVGLAMRQAPRVDLCALWARRPEAVAALAAELGINRVYHDMEHMWHDDAVDAVYVALPNHLHASVTLAALRAGKHVLVEKPMACTAVEVAEMQQVARAHNRVVMEAMMYRNHPQTTQVEALIASGAIGEVRQVHVAFGYRQDNPHDIRMVEPVGAGAIFDIGCYGVNLVNRLMPVLPTQVWGDAVCADNRVDVLATSVVRYSGMQQAHINVSFVGGFYQHARIIGYDGVIELERPFTLLPDREASIRLWRGAHFATLEHVVVPATNHFVAQAEVFARAVADPPHRSELTEESATLANAAVIDAWHRSLVSGQPERVVYFHESV